MYGINGVIPIPPGGILVLGTGLITGLIVHVVTIRKVDKNHCETNVQICKIHAGSTTKLRLAGETTSEIQTFGNCAKHGSGDCCHLCASIQTSGKEGAGMTSESKLTAIQIAAVPSCSDDFSCLYALRSDGVIFSKDRVGHKGK